MQMGKGTPLRLYVSDFHIDEAMSSETIRNLKRMPPILLIVRNICIQGKAPQAVLENIRELDELLKEVQSEFHN